MKAQRIVEDVVYKVYPNSEKKSAPVHELALRKKKKNKKYYSYRTKENDVSRLLEIAE